MCVHQAGHSNRGVLDIFLSTSDVTPRILLSDCRSKQLTLSELWLGVQLPPGPLGSKSYRRCMVQLGQCLVEACVSTTIVGTRINFANRAVRVFVCIIDFIMLVLAGGAPVCRFKGTPKEHRSHFEGPNLKKDTHTG